MTKHIHADKIMQFARMVEAGHSPQSLVQVKIIQFGVASWFPCTPIWNESDEYRVAIAFVDGKPVFKDDRLFYKDLRKWVIADCINSFDEWKTFFVCWMHEGFDSGIAGIDSNCFSWSNPEERRAQHEFEITHRIGDTSVTVIASSLDDAVRVIKGKRE